MRLFSALWVYSTCERPAVLTTGRSRHEATKAVSQTLPDFGSPATRNFPPAPRNSFGNSPYFWEFQDRKNDGPGIWKTRFKIFTAAAFVRSGHGCIAVADSPENARSATGNSPRRFDDNGTCHK